MTTNGTVVRLEFRSAFDMLDFVQVVSDHLGQMVGLDEDAMHWVGVAVRESVINAIKHGNGSDERKLVHVEFAFVRQPRDRRAGHCGPRSRARASIRRASPIRLRPRTC